MRTQVNFWAFLDRNVLIVVLVTLFGMAFAAAVVDDYVRYVVHAAPCSK